ncbi:MAG: helix-turn-helix domain-containing protein [Candidatus Eremiobacteraeota bacterium]|nr:helix-turn-helix domain-containing protein [Candidatus Eremiobacteraeota bacterium]MBC5803402.1 helix-turn-helix domain-containing protein [Candidatus Eremiobacteraeota bacterium]MBC5822506.1 helix-turn-helix domain-containing protein [Candidatus Eremiobacteraeota bacterium]
MPARTTRALRRNQEGEPAFRGAPNVSQILKRMRLSRKLSIRDVAEGSGLSASFLSAVERGESDVSIGRLARIAEFFDQDLGSMLGYSARLSRPSFVGRSDRTMFNRGKGVRYELLRLPGVNLEVAVMAFDPRCGFRDELTHEGVDILYVTSGEVVLRVNEVDYSMHAGQCAVYSAAYAHTLRNDSARAASAIGLTTAHM